MAAPRLLAPPGWGAEGRRPGTAVGAARAPRSAAPGQPRRRRAPWGGRVVGVAVSTTLATLLGACSLLVPEEPERILCTDEGAIGPPACGAAEVCAAGECITCRDQDACGDGVDDDCDGQIDDGC